MKRPKKEPPVGRSFRLSHFLLGIGILYLIFISFKFPQFLEIASLLSGNDSYVESDGEKVGDSEDSDLRKTFFNSVFTDTFHRKLEDNQNQDAPLKPDKESLEEGKKWVQIYKAASA